MGAFAQNVVQGHVKDSSGEPIIGATVRVIGQDGGTITDLDGNFSIKANPSDKLQISFIGYQTLEVNASNGMTITLQDDNKVLDDVVVIGYGRAKKNDLTGSVTAIKPDDMNKGLQVSAQDMIQGKIAGVNVVNNGGEPGGNATIRIRGGSSLNASNDPLIVIDGLAMDNYGMQGSSNPLNLVNPNDIESFTVLKDASATAIYGSRASNGVIIITTKKGRKNMKPTISYNGNVSVSVLKKKFEVLTGDELVNFVKEKSELSDDEWLASEYYKNLGYTDAEGNKHFANTDWQDEIYRTAISTDHNVTLTGAVKNLPYRVSFGYTNQQGIVKTSNYERFTGSVSLNPTFLQDHLSVNFNAKGMYSKTSYEAGAIGAATSMDPTKPVYGKGLADEDIYNSQFGGYFQYFVPLDRGDSYWKYNPNTTATVNPVALLNGQSDKGKGKELTGNLELDYKIHGFEDLHLHANFGMDVKSGKSNKYYERWSTNAYYYGNQGWNKQDTYNLSMNLYAQYLKDLNEAHHIDVMAGYEWQHFHKKTDYYYYTTYPSTSTAHADEIYTQSENTLYKTENYLVSFFGRLNYSLLDRYLLTFTMRADGSSRFASNQRWGYFPSLALAWKIKDEAFLKNVNALSDAKLRLGWGKTGQQEGIGDYDYIAAVKTNSNYAYYPIVGDGSTQMPSSYNPDLTWEKTTTYNIGLDLSFLNDRLSFNLDWYYRKTTDLLNNVVIAAGTNFSNMLMSNIGELHNTGFEFATTIRPIQTKDWRWELNYNLTYNKNKIDKLVASDDPDYMILHGGLAVSNDASTDGIQAYKVGQAVTAYYVYQQVYDKNGEPIQGCYVDRNGDGQITAADRYFYKKSDPDVTMGLSSKVIYKNWDFGVTFRASINNYVYNAVGVDRSRANINYLYNNNAWNNASVAGTRLCWSDLDVKEGLTDYFIQNASFLKCDNITVGYSFDKFFSLPLRGRAYLTAQNVFTITKYNGMDPEINGGYDSNIYPRPFTAIFGVNLNF